MTVKERFAKLLKEYGDLQYRCGFDQAHVGTSSWHRTDAERARAAALGEFERTAHDLAQLQATFDDLYSENVRLKVRAHETPAGRLERIADLAAEFFLGFKSKPERDAIRDEIGPLLVAHTSDDPGSPECSQ